LLLHWCAKAVGTIISHLDFSAAAEPRAFTLCLAATHRGRREGRQASSSDLLSLLLRPVYFLRRDQIVQFWVDQSNTKLRNVLLCVSAFFLLTALSLTYERQDCQGRGVRVITDCLTEVN